MILYVNAAVMIQAGLGLAAMQGRMNLPGGLHMTNRGASMELVFVGMLVVYAFVAAVLLYLAWILVHAVVRYLEVKTRKRNMEARQIERDLKGPGDRSGVSF